jgi:hypothetical protein
MLVELGIFSVISTIHATNVGEVDSSKDAVGEPFASNAGDSLRMRFHLRENFSFGAVTESSGGEESASELNRKLTNRSAASGPSRISLTTSS